LLLAGHAVAAACGAGILALIAATAMTGAKHHRDAGANWIAFAGDFSVRHLNA
jgi:hypothetical protein